MILPMAFSSDAAILQAWKKNSFTPVVGQLLSLPPHLRQTFHGYLLLGMLPPKIKNIQVLYQAIMDTLHKRGLLTGLTVEDATDP